MKSSNDPHERAPSDARAARPDARALEPRLVIRGESTRKSECPAFIDWLAFTVEPKAAIALPWLYSILEEVFNLRNRTEWIPSRKGWCGYTNRIDLGVYGLIAFGGEAQKNTMHVELNAHACAVVSNWGEVKLWGEEDHARITRIDLAHDDLEAKTFDIARGLELLAQGGFAAGGRPPKARLVDDLGSGAGKTLYVGHRVSGKLLRIYEKGKQLGCASSPWVRVEVELRNKGREIPWDVALAPERYLAGAYPALAFLSTEQCRLRTLQRATAISYEAMVKNLRTQSGKALCVMTRVHEGDAAAVLVQVIREGMPKRLRGFEDGVDGLRPEPQE